MPFNEVLKSITTEDDANETYEPLRIAFLTVVLLAALGTLTYIGLSVWEVVVQKNDFEPVNYATGLAAIIAGFGALIAQTGVGLWVSSKQQSDAGGK